jgi:hypothetical protein
MKIIHYISNVCILLGTVSLIGGIVFKVFMFQFFGLMPGSFLRLANTCLLLGMALYIRELIPKETA